MLFGKLVLVRYYQGYNIIEKLSIFENKLLVQSSSKIDLRPINKDPRQTNRANNGYTYTHQHQLQLLYYLQNSQFLIATSKVLEIVNLKTEDNVLECSFPNTGVEHIQLQIECNKNPHKPFYHTCVQLK